jgi:alginate O-acetyltransferase complex protein AlgI
VEVRRAFALRKVVISRLPRRLLVAGQCQFKARHAAGRRDSDAIAKRGFAVACGIAGGDSTGAPHPSGGAGRAGPIRPLGRIFLLLATIGMVFSSNLFLFLFLPLVLAGYYLSPRALRNSWLLATSLLFYAWGGLLTAGLLVVSIVMNYALGLWVDRVRDRPSVRAVMALAMALNLVPLFYFKYAGFCLDTLSVGLASLGFEGLPSHRIALPIGISFFTFQAMSYVIDVYRRDTPVAKNPVEVALYVAFFPQLIAGPIVRYRDVADQLNERRETAAQFAEGIERFVIGLSKKVLLANAAASAADQIFAIPGGELTASVAWLGIVCYTLQIYYDFSGYSDMAVGLGLMFGIRFLENFNYPYAARSITEFWRRWHISLSVWFRDYLYIPLGGNRHGTWRTYRNLLIVFLLCGLWHGAGWNFIVWGLLYGVFLILERCGLSRLLERAPVFVAHGYVMLVVMAGWVLFRAADLAQAGDYFAALCGLSRATGAAHPLALYLDAPLAVLLVLGAIGSVPWMPAARRTLADWRSQRFAGSTLERPSEWSFELGRVCALAGLSVVVAVVLSASTYNPFIYFKF